MMTELAGRVAIVTGSARNIGRAIALALADAGASVVVHGGAPSAEADATAEAVRAKGVEAALVFGDTADPATAEALVAAATQRLGALDIVVSNAAARSNVPFPKMPRTDFERIVAVAFGGTYNLAQAAVPALIAGAESGRKGYGRIIGLGGMHATKGAPGRSHVMAAKAGMAALLRGLALDLAPWGVTANVVAPGMIETVRPASAGSAPAQHDPIPLGRKGRPEDIANAVRFFCSPGAEWITGQTLHVNGGEYLNL
jgi:3-oxoacyl-[acyl-carrier protein] reductase